jgi:hypothetical protein
MKNLLIILFLFSTAKAQVYFVIPTMNNPEAKALIVSKRFYQLIRPLKGNDVTEYLFGYVKHPTNDSVAIVIDTNFNIPKGSITATEITNWINEVYGTLTTTQRNTLTNYINNNSLLKVARLILTARIRLWSEAELKARGWLPTVTL